MEQNLIELLDNKLGMDYSAQLYLNNLMYNEYLDIIKEIVEEFNKNGICYCILKGFSKKGFLLLTLYTRLKIQFIENFQM